MDNSLSDTLTSRLVSAFFRFNRTPWHNVPADGMSQVETDILENIWRANRRETILRVLDLSMILRVTSPTISQHLNNLEEQGYVERIHSRKDKRTIMLSITKKGEEALKSHRMKLEEDFSEFVSLLGEEECERLIDYLGEAQTFFSYKAKIR